MALSLEYQPRVVFNKCQVYVVCNVMVSMHRLIFKYNLAM